PHLSVCSRGFTLMELLVVIAIILIITPVLYASIDSLYDSHAYSLAGSFALMHASKGTENIIRDVRSAVYAEDGSLPIVAYATSSLTFYSDTDSDGRVEQVRYYLDGSVLHKGVVEPTSTSSYPIDTEVVTPLASHITNGETQTPLFRYFTSTSTEIVADDQTLDIRRVEVTVQARASFRVRTRDVSISSSASIRNLKNTY
ncbi:MAG: prepilin-type N-terminal cleavage/methylation domain-containing protein, partial [Candidatus Pacebacteria bacterium]|nr:prepilin-type N-terminal cleavage/methylation domain-containing protein [Candidatus Paceibacterota bacterium]